MKKMLNNQIRSAIKRPASSSEMNSLAVIQSVSEEGFRTGWKAGRKSSTQASIARDRAALMDVAEQAAATTEYA